MTRHNLPPEQHMLTGLGIQPEHHAAARAFGDQVSAACDTLVVNAQHLLQHLERAEYDEARDHGAQLEAWLDTLDENVQRSVMMQLAYAVVGAAKATR